MGRQALNNAVTDIANALRRLGIDVGTATARSLPDLTDELQRMADKRENENFDKRFRLSGMCTPAYFSDYLDNSDRGLDIDMLKDLLTLAFIENRTNIVFWGNSGTGKSRLAKMLATAACHADMRVRWTDFPQLYRELEQLKLTDTRRFESRMNYYSRFDLLCIDEFLNYDCSDYFILQEFFKRIDDIGHCTIIICCQNTPGNWNKLFKISSFGESVRGRILQNSKLINTRGKDLRLSD